MYQYSHDRKVRKLNAPFRHRVHTACIFSLLEPLTFSWLNTNIEALSVFERCVRTCPESVEILFVVCFTNL